MPGSYLPKGQVDLEDFFAQVVPPPPPTDRVGGMVFMAPLDSASGLWFAYHRRGHSVARLNGRRSEVERWAMSQDVAERWVYNGDHSAYEPLLQSST